MNRRVALLGLVAVLALSGCVGSTEIPEEDLTGEASYDWNRSTTVSVDLSRSSYATVVNVTDRSELTVFARDALGTEAPVDIEALRFRYPNGTVVNATHTNLSATLGNKQTSIQLPAERGRVGYTAARTGKEFATPVFVNGSYGVTLPPSSRVGVPLLSQAGPGGYETSVADNRQTLTWETIEDGTVQVRYYLQRDLWLFGGLIAIAASIGVGGAAYYLRQIRRLKAKREDLGLAVEYEDDPTDEGPPPGMP